jgi:hypothetical protein
MVFCKYLGVFAFSKVEHRYGKMKKTGSETKFFLK